MQHVTEVLQQPGCARDLEYIGLTVSLTANSSKNDHTIAHEDDIADKFGMACIIFATKRIVRTAWLLRGWPVYCLGYCCNEPLASATANRFHEDLTALQALAMVPKEKQSAAMQTVLRRTCFLDTSV